MSIEPRAEPGEDCLSGRVPHSSNALVLAPHLREGDVGACVDLLTVAEPTDEKVLTVTCSETAADKAGRWDERVGTDPDEFAVIEVGDGGATDDADSPTVRTVSDPGDLAALGLAVDEQLAAWAGTTDHVVVCFQSLTTLVEHVDLPELFRFLHVLLGRLDAADATAHCHLDPGAVDEAQLNSLKPLFDAVVRVDGGSVRIEDA